MPGSNGGGGFVRVSRPRLYERLVEQLLGFIAATGLGPGDLLPAERELAERMGVSRATLAQALVALEVLGVIDVQHGTGAVLVYRPSVASVLRELREHGDRMPEIVEARSTLEVKLAALAAERRTPADLAAVEAALEAMAGEISSGSRGTHGDELFHQAVASAAHSSILASMMTFISELVRETRLASLGQPGRPERSLESHRAIADAIRAADPDAAAAAMQAHIDLVSETGI
ncbi:FCD domain-containing protein [Arthrobacter sp. zg-Y877]|uniref:FadR/GntR family transcriptional regulator n=1 Tax=Arthrobacter sp. zg-Y877 TaxID=3049074 RepID=UPI0025A36D76|nr:FCD domain-containing protein [Arthrobacter sp. zg-Y877]MDM7989565.1 FCD domain-containing protein [Arthrobacter sp. zg-Y877]